MKIYSYLGSGKPVVATRLPTHTQVLDDQTACLTEATPEAFASGMLRLMDDEILRNKYGAAGKRLVEERHSFRVFRQKVNSLYEWLETDTERQAAFRIRPATRSPKELGVENLVPQEMRIYYQPIVSLDTGEITGFEALVRWQHPDHGLLSPSEFITRAEETGQIIPIGQWVLHEACRQLREWNLQFPSIIPLSICVNLSAKQLQQPDLIEQIDRVLEETGLDTQSLILEVSDRAILESAESGSEAVLQLQARGVQVHIDYFDAAGDASLRLLEGLPVDKIKIDRALLSGVNKDEVVTAKIQHAIDTARSAGADVVAVGVETKEHLEQVKALKCEFGQGYLFSRPLDEHSVEELMVSPPWIEKAVG
jgi:EAL domain-containing protein (putative c-di-GMP-specific phosphodiesterase class I)